MPKSKKRKVEPSQMEELNKEEATRLMPPPPPAPPCEPLPPSAPVPASPHKQAVTAAKAEVALWAAAVRYAKRQAVKANTAFEAAGRKFDGQMIRLKREQKRSSGVAAWTVDQKMHRAEIGLREARLRWEVTRGEYAAALLGHQEALVAQRDVTIAHLQRPHSYAP